MFDDLSDAEFELFSKLIYLKAGINLQAGKKELLRARLAKRLRNSHFSSFQDYYNYLIKDKSGQELILLLDNVSTNLTSFFREAKHFKYLSEEVLPRLLAERKKTGKLRIWSAGCSSGEEAYSIVITILEQKALPPNPNVKVLATDISTRVLGMAKNGIYPEDKCRDIDGSILKKYYLKGQGDWAGHVRIKPFVKNFVCFQRHNLMERCPFPEPMDVIFCRNVMIYFDKATQEKLVNTFYSSLAGGGHLFVGHSESLTGVKHSFKYLQPTIYIKE